MPLIPSSQMSWNEPIFFVARLREPWGWSWRGLMGLGVAIVMFIAIRFGGNAQQFELWQALGISLAAGAVLVILADVSNFQREVSIYKDSINYVGSAGTWSMGEFKMEHIRNVKLLRPEDWNRPFAAMLLNFGDEGFLLGVPKKVELDTIANVLHRLGLSVQLEGWEPSESDTRVQVKDEVVLPKDAAPAADARIWPVDAQDRKLTPPVTMGLMITMALGPLLLGLIGLIAAGIYLFMNWSDLSILNRSLIGGGAFAFLVASFLYLILAGQFLASRYAVHVGRKILAQRPGALFLSDDENLRPVEVFDRTAWTSVAAKSIDFGFLQVDPSRRLIQFEGNENRWHLPAAALTTCRIEEAHVGSEGNAEAEKRYYVVISTHRDGETWEAGMQPSRIHVGNDTKEERYDRAKRLFEEISSMITT
ncbi:hypothetical protein Mal4_44680 [Maioricimonas rarisocia]|uniref:PH domain-containing protein n=1 Tax=Maioricimonas rarisocia TaxID=2528026 RepID=A0A517ZC87_9PLAN|nr:hypothetical protein [Maioricimonas rarisocia]QDU40113.1 hypothetical protein Mal4_44680 [Maioricimonas rarisocia]